MTTEHTVVGSGKSKRKPFNSDVADYLPIVATFAFICTVVAPGVAATKTITMTVASTSAEGRIS
jgi:hypothetical protein